MTHKPTPETTAVAEALSRYGIKQAEIAQYIGIAEKTLRLYYGEVMEKARLEAHKTVADFIYNSASGKAMIENDAKHADCLKAAFFYAKTQMGWRETNNLDLTSSDGSMTPQGIDVSKLSNQALAELMNARSTSTDE